MKRAGADREARHVWPALGLAIVLFLVGCGSNSEPPVSAESPLAKWAGEVCSAFARHTEAVEATSAGLRAIEKAVDHPDVYKGKPSPVRSNASQIATRAKMLAALSRYRAAEEALLTTLSTLSAPKTAAGRRGQRLIERDGVDLVRQNLAHLDRVERRLSRLPVDAEPIATVNALGFLIAAADRFAPASLVALGIRDDGELDNAFRAAPACESWPG